MKLINSNLFSQFIFYSNLFVNMQNHVDVHYDKKKDSISVINLFFLDN